MADTIPLHRNESYWLLDGLGEVLHGDIRTYATYPPYAELGAAYARVLGTDATRLLLTPGSDAAIAAIADWCAREGKNAVLPVPTFYGYERILAARHVPTRFTYYTNTDSDPSFPADETIAAMQGGNTVVFLCQPNNPFGSLIPESEMARIIERARVSGTYVVVDEAYAEFGNPSLVGEASETVIVLRTLSKGFGLAGARIGGCIAEPELNTAFAERFLPWSIAHPSVHAALAVFSHPEELASRRESLIRTRDAFSRELSALDGFKPLVSRTNFLYVSVPDALRLAADLRSDGILIAPGSELSFDVAARRILANGVRIATPAPEHTQRVLDALRKASAVPTART